jgi:hypothetical protein
MSLLLGCVHDFINCRFSIFKTISIYIYSVHPKLLRVYIMRLRDILV